MNSHNTELLTDLELLDFCEFCQDEEGRQDYLAALIPDNQVDGYCQTN